MKHKATQRSSIITSDRAFLANADEKQEQAITHVLSMHLETFHAIEWAITHELARRNKMDALQKNIAVTRGEALAARLLATIAIQFAFSMASDRQRLLTRLSAFVDDTLNLSGPAKGDANDEFNTQVRETARFQAMQTLDEIARMLNEPPMKG